MKKQEILKEITYGLKCLSAENPRTLNLMLDYYVDTYYEDSFCALILKWDQLGYGDFDEMFPVTAKLVAELTSMWDGIERHREVYAGIISMAKDALKEVKEYKES